MTMVWESDDALTTLNLVIGPREGDPPSTLHYELLTTSVDGIPRSAAYFTAAEIDRLALAIMKPHDEDVSI